MVLIENLGINLKRGEYPKEDPYEVVFVLKSGKKLGFIYSCGKGDWRVYGIDLGMDARSFPNIGAAITWVYLYKPGLVKATKARGDPAVDLQELKEPA